MSKLLTYALFTKSVILGKLLQNDTHDNCGFLACNIFCWWWKDSEEWQTLMDSACHKEWTALSRTNAEIELWQREIRKAH